MKATKPFLVGFALALAPVAPAETASSVSFAYDVTDMTSSPPPGRLSFDPEIQGWTPTELSATAGEDTDGDGRIDISNFGPIYDHENNPIAWQIHDQLTGGTVDSPRYFRNLQPADYQALFYEGWTFTFVVRTGATLEVTGGSSPGDIIRAGFTGWTVQAADDPGWGLAGRGTDAARVGFWVGNDNTALPGGGTTRKFWIEDPSGRRTVLGVGSADDFHVIQCIGTAGSPVYEWFLDGESMGMLDMLDSPLNSGSLVQFSSGQSSPRGGAVDWRLVELASCPPLGPDPLGQSVIAGEIERMRDTLRFVFNSTFPPGTDFQPQYAESLDGGWLDLQDASVTFLRQEGGVRVFEVMAPNFGTDTAFYRVVSASEAAQEAPVADTLSSPSPVSEEQLLLFVAQSGGNDDGSTAFEGQILSYLEDGPSPGVQSRVTADLDEVLTSDDSGMQDFVVADLDGSGLPRPIFCWPDSSGQLQIVIRSVPQSGADWPDEMIVWAIPGSLAAENRGTLRIVKAQLDDDDFPELVVAWSGRTGLVHMVPVDFNEDYTTAPTIGAEDSSTDLFNGNLSEHWVDRFDLVAGNFDGDAEGRDEVAIVAGVDPMTSGDTFSVLARFFDIDTTGTSLKTDFDGGEHLIFGRSLSTGEGRNTFSLAALASDSDCDGRDELFVGTLETFVGDVSGRYRAWGIRPPDPGGTFEQGPEFAPLNPVTSGTVTLEAVNLDEDQADELLLAGPNEWFLKIQPDLSFVQLGVASELPGLAISGRRSLSMIKLDIARPSNTIPGTPLVAVATPNNFFTSGSDNATTVGIYAIVNDGGQVKLSEISSKLLPTGPIDGFVSPGIIAAPFSPLDIKLGVPRKYTRIVSNRPTVVLNAPPIHFDIIDGVEYDVSDIFPTSDIGPGGSPFVATYTRTMSETVTVETQWKRSWAVSAEVSGGFSVGPVGVEVAVRSSVGQDLDDFASNFETTTVTTEISAVDDDRIYATTLNYDIWEYPVLLEDEVVGHVIVTDPSVTRDRWFGSKSIVAQNYRSYHEVGNLMSYRSEIPPETSDEFIRPLEAGDAFTISGAAGDQIWKLTRTTGSTTRESRTFNFSVGATASFSAPIPWVPDVEISGDYSSSSLASSSSSIEDSEGMSVSLGSVAGSIAGTDYAITPYVYWNDSGAIVLDYAVEPFTGTPSQPTFWGTNYGGSPDPTFVLPFRHDPEKGLSLVLDRQRRLTRDIITLPPEPRPGQDVTVVARLSNFSFLAVTEPLRVDFYLGDPGVNGTLIHSATVSADELEGQGKVLVEFPWEVPNTLTAASFEIHAVIDPQNAIDEVQETNNSGWNEIFLRRGP